MTDSTWRLALTVLDRGTGDTDDLVVQVPADATVDDLAALLGTDHLDLGGQVLAPTASLAEAGLRSGQVLGKGGDGSSSTARPACWLTCVGGSQAGSRWPLQDTLSIGRAANNDVRIASPLASSTHATVQLEGEVVTLVDQQSTNGTLLDGVPLDPGTPYPVGHDSAFQVGPALFEVRPAEPNSSTAHRQGDGSLLVRRQPRLGVRLGETPGLQPPKAPAAREPSPIPWPSFLMPMILGVAAAAFFGRPEMLLFIALGPVGGGAQMLHNRRQDRRRSASEARDHARAVADFERERAAWARTAGDALRDAAPDPTRIEDIVSGPGPRLWERRPADDDFLMLRIGSSSRFLDDDEVHWIANAPETLGLYDCGVVGVAGKRSRQLAVARWMVAQLCAVHAPEDLQVAAIGPERAMGAWAWLRWLPHAGSTAEAPATQVGFAPADRGRVLSWLIEMIDQRRENPRRQTLPVVVVLLDGADQLRDEAGVARVLADGPAVAVYTIALDETLERLPEEARAAVACNEGEDRVIDMTSKRATRAILLDEVTSVWAEDVARRLAPLRLGDPADVLPQRCRLLDDLGSVDQPETLVTAWAASAGPSTLATLGRSATGPFAIDLRGDGPHALVAGTTGAGKTGLLLALLTSLAAQTPPDALNFVLMDWKGGADFADCRRLPHTRAVVTNLDRATSERAVLSIGAEVARRQSILNDLASAGTISSANVSTLWQTDPELAREHGLPILVVVVDEFNRFIEEVPELVTELLAVTQQGRSLGIHLVLAMQQVPQSSTMTKLLANISLRIVLRTAPGESRVILSNDDADEIPKSAIGRGLVRVGEPPRIVAFQTGFLQGRPGVAGGQPTAAVRAWGAPGPAVVDEHRLDETDLSATTHAIIKAASGIALPPSPLQPPLPERLPLTDLAQYANPTWGVIDRPDATRLEDRLLPLDVDPHEPGNLGIVASSTYGRTTALASLALSMAQRLSPDALHVHAIDVTNSGLRDLDFLPHAGTIAVRDIDRTYRLVDHLSAELDARLARPDQPQPLQVLLVDTWETMLEQYDAHSDAVQQILALAREGPRVGMVLATAGEARLLNPPLASLLGQRLVLTLLDTGQYALAGMRAPDRPSPPGRGRLMSNEAGEVQVAYPDGGIETAARTVAEGWPDQARTNPPVRLRSLPGLLHLADLPTVPDDGPLHVRFAVGGQEVGPIGIDFSSEGPAVAVVGPRGSGRTTLLWAAAQSADRKGLPFLVVAPMAGTVLGDTAELTHCLGVFDGRDDDELITALEASRGPLLLLIDDAQRLLGTRADDVLRAFVTARGLGQVGTLVATDPDGAEGARSGVLAETRRAGSGVIFSPSNLTARHVGLSGLPEHLLGRQGPGRAVLSLAGRPVAIQVAT